MHLENKKDHKVLVYNTSQEAQNLIDRFGSGYTDILVNHDSSQFAVWICPIDRHQLTQTERDSMTVIDTTFFTG